MTAVRTMSRSTRLATIPPPAPPRDEMWERIEMSCALRTSGLTGLRQDWSGFSLAPGVDRQARDGTLGRGTRGSRVPRAVDWVGPELSTPLTR